MSVPHDFSSLFELLPIGAYRSDAHGKLVRVNKAMAQLFGHASEEKFLAVAQSGKTSRYVLPERRKEFRDQLLSQGVVRDFKSELRRDTGEMFWISENAHTVKDAQGQLLYYEGTAEDITARVDAEKAIVQANALLRERTLIDFAKRHAITPAHAALGWLLAQADVYVIPKTGRRDRLRDNLQAQEHPLSAAQVAELCALVPAPKHPEPLAML